MRRALSGGTRLSRRGAWGVLAVVTGALLVAMGLQVRALTHVDPRARGSWRATPLSFDETPRDVTLFVAGCDVEAVQLRPARGGSGRVAVETFVATIDGGTAGSGPGIVITPGADGTYRVPLPDHPPWRSPLVLRIRALDEVLTLAAAAPITLGAPGGALGTLPCAFDGARGRTWIALGSLGLVIVSAAVVAAAWLVRGLGRAPTPAGAPVTTAAVTAVAASVLLYALAVPPFEPPDELAHLQYARYVATTASLPAAVPSVGSEWRASSYEWVQQPLYYLGAAALLRATGLHAPGPQLVANPRSRLQPGGTEPTLFQHGAPIGDRRGHRALGLLRGLSLLMALGTAWLVARLARTVTQNSAIVLTVAGGLALIPQWAAVMGAVSTDPPATLLAAAATLAIIRVAGGRTSPPRLLAAGALIGAGYAVKATAAFLVPMALCACLTARVAPDDRPGPARDAVRSIAVARLFAVRVAWLALGAGLVAGWIPLRAWWLYGDPFAFEFKRAVLEAGGFLPVAGPMPWTSEFWAQMQTMVFEPFWARFGSLGGGPLPGSRVWRPYAVASLLLAALASTSLVTMARRSRARDVGTEERSGGAVSARTVALCGIGVLVGLAGWVAVNLAPRADMVVHWTPRHILPLTAPAAVLVAAGLERLTGRDSRVARLLAILVGLTVVSLALAYVSVFRATLLTMHFGY